MAERTPVILCIDVEPDSRRPDPTKAAPWRGFERLYPYLRELRQRMADASGEAARLNWFWRLDPQVEMVYGSAEWALRRYEGGGRGDGPGGRRARSASSCLAMGCDSSRMGA